jgi:hypothetical protein
VFECIDAVSLPVINEVPGNTGEGRPLEEEKERKKKKKKKKQSKSGEHQPLFLQRSGWPPGSHPISSLIAVRFRNAPTSRRDYAPSG